MASGDASQIYFHFLDRVATSSRAWCLSCHGDPVSVHGGSHRFMFPLWPDLDSARYFIALHWPDLKASDLSLSLLLRRCLPLLAREDIPTGVGLAPYSEAVVVPANRLRRDLIAQRMRGQTTH